MIYTDSRSIGYNPIRFLLESLKDLNDRLTLHGGCLYILRGNPIEIFKRIKDEIGLDLITFEQVIIFFYTIRENPNSNTFNTFYTM